MPGRTTDRIEIPDSLWRRPETLEALRARDIGPLFHLLRQYAGLSQTRIGIACGFSQGQVSRIMSGARIIATLEVFERIADGLHMPDPARLALGLASSPPSPHSPAAFADTVIHPRDTAQQTPGAAPRPASNVGLRHRDKDEDPVRRRSFVGLAGAALIESVLADPADTPQPPAALEDLAATLTLPGLPPASSRPPDLSALAARVTDAKRSYQACRYSHVTAHLPGLLADLRAACAHLDGDDRRHALALSAEAHHVAASIMLKLDDKGLAHLAADRSMRAATASTDPVIIGSSARIITHALMSSGHLRAATTTARDLAARMDADTHRPTPASLSVYGSLLLRGAIAASLRNDRPTTAELLDEADQAAQRLGGDHNHRWTAFGPTNLLLHRVNIAVTLGDAGTALDVARRVDLDKIPIMERKATFLVDTARAFMQWDKHDKALNVLRAAEQLAHEEIAARPSVHRIVRDLITSAPPSLRPHAQEFAGHIGATR